MVTDITALSDERHMRIQIAKVGTGVLLGFNRGQTLKPGLVAHYKS